MFYLPLTVDISGMWTMRLAKKVICQLEAETLARGIVLKPVEIPELRGHQRVKIQVFCARHDYPILSNSACERCLKEVE